MSFTLLQAGSSLQMMDDSGNLTTLTLPTGVTLRTDVLPRWELFANYVILVNTPEPFSLSIDGDGTVRPFNPPPPTSAPVVSQGDAAGSLTGTYTVRYTFLIKDAAGNIIAESEMSPISNSVAITSANLKVASLETSPYTISARRVYRTTTGGSTYFPWIEVEGNTITEVEDDLSDAGLSLVAAPDLGNPPRFTSIKEWKGLLWGVGDTAPDELVFSLPDAYWTFTADSAFTVSGSGRDNFGIRSLMPRRESLGVGRRDQIWQVVGDSSDDFRLIKLSENTGIESGDSVATYRDIVFWLWKDGVYQWDSEGIRNICDGQVKSWFTSGDYFNRDLFTRAFAVFDPVRLKYRLYLAATGTVVINRWVEYDLQTKTWWGPHKTDAFSPTSAFLRSDAADKVTAIAGSSDGFVWEEQSTATDNTATGIAFDVQTRFFDGGIADMEKFWGQLSILGKVQSGGTLTITPKVGYLNASAQTAISHSMSTGRQRLRRLGVGKLAQLGFTHSAAGEPVEIYGLELPYHFIGRR